MNPLFENSYQRTKNIAKEMYRYFYYQRPIYIIGYIVATISLVSSILSYISFQDFDALVIGTSLFIFGFPTLLYVSQVRAMVARDKEAFGCEPQATITFTEESIFVTCATVTTMEYTYDKIAFAVQTKNLILLKTKANLIIIVRKDSFTLGTKEDFIAFLLGKGLTVKGK